MLEKPRTVVLDETAIPQFSIKNTVEYKSDRGFFKNKQGIAHKDSYK